MKTIIVIAVLGAAGYAAYRYRDVIKAFVAKVIAKIKGH